MEGVNYVDYNIQPLKQFLIKIDGLKDTYMKGALNRLYEPSNLWNETGGLCERGTILKAPLSLKNKWPDLVGKDVIFSFTEAHAAIKKDSLYVKGCLLVNPDSIIQVDNRTYGQWIFCERIPIETSLIYEPDMKLAAFDSSRKGEVKRYDYHLDKGRVARENEHFPVGTVVYWGKASYVNQEWQAQNGFLVKHRSLKAYGDEIINWKSLNI